MEKPIYFSIIEFQERLIYHSVRNIIHINIPEGEISYQVFGWQENMPSIEGIEKIEFLGEEYFRDFGKPGKKIKNSYTNQEYRFIPDEQMTCEVLFSYGIKLNEQQIEELLHYCNALEFEPYRDREMSMDDEGYCGYRDEIMVKFVGVTDSYIPKMEWDMQYYYDKEHIWPSERLYHYVLSKYLINKKTRGWVSEYGAGSLPI